MQRIFDLAIASTPGAEVPSTPPPTTLSGLQFSSAAPNDELPMRVGEVQYKTCEGPCVDSLRAHDIYSAKDVAIDTGFGSRPL